MGRARERELIIAPLQVVKAAGFEERHDLKRLRAGTPVGEASRIASARRQSVTRVDHRCVDTMAGFDHASTSRDYVEIKRLHGASYLLRGRSSLRNITEPSRCLGPISLFG